MGQIQFQVPGEPPPTSPSAPPKNTGTPEVPRGSSGGETGSENNDSPTYDDDSTEPNGQTVAEQFAANLAAVGAIVNPDSLQPVAPQSPGNLLTGKLGTSSSMNWKIVIIVAIVAVAGFYLWKKYRG